MNWDVQGFLHTPAMVSEWVQPLKQGVAFLSFLENPVWNFIYVITGFHWAYKILKNHLKIYGWDLFESLQIHLKI